MTLENILELKDIRKSFFGAPVLRDVSLQVQRGEVLGLVGENGAGKSTLMNILGGVLSRDSGSMVFKGQPYEPVDPKDAVKAGIAFIHQELNLFSNLTVAENIFIDELPTGLLGAVKYGEIRARAQEHIDRFGVQASAATRVGSLPMGVRQTIEITKDIRSYPWPDPVDPCRFEACASAPARRTTSRARRRWFPPCAPGLRRWLAARLRAISG